MLHVLLIYLDLITIIVLRVQITNIYFPVVTSCLDSTSDIITIVRHLQSLFFYLMFKARLHIHDDDP